MIPKSKVMVDRKACEAGEVVCVVGGGGVLLVFTRIESDMKGEF